MAYPPPTRRNRPERQIPLKRCKTVVSNTRHEATLGQRATIGAVARGYAEGPASEERFEALERGQVEEETLTPERQAVYGSTPDDAEQHFIGWLEDVNPDRLFASGKAWGLKIVRRRDD